MLSEINNKLHIKIEDNYYDFEKVQGSIKNSKNVEFPAKDKIVEHFPKQTVNKILKEIDSGCCSGYAKTMLSKLLTATDQPLPLKIQTVDEVASVIKMQLNTGHTSQDIMSKVLVKELGKFEDKLKTLKKKHKIDLFKCDKSTKKRCERSLQKRPLKHLQLICESLRAVKIPLNIEAKKEIAHSIERISKKLSSIQKNKNYSELKEKKYYDKFEMIANQLNCNFDNIVEEAASKIKPESLINIDVCRTVWQAYKQQLLQFSKSTNTTDNHKSFIKKANEIIETALAVTSSKKEWKLWSQHTAAQEKNDLLLSHTGESFYAKTKNRKKIFEKMRVFSKCNENVIFMVHQAYKKIAHVFLVQKTGNQFILYDVNHAPKLITDEREIKKVVSGKYTKAGDKVIETTIVPYFPGNILK